MPRSVFNLVCSVLFITIMSGIAYVLTKLPLQFEEGMAVGTLLTLSTLYVCHKLGAPLF